MEQEDCHNKYCCTCCPICYPTESFINKEIKKSLEFHINQLKVNQSFPVVAHHHEIIINYIVTELKPRLSKEVAYEQRNDNKHF